MATRYQLLPDIDRWVLTHVMRRLGEAPSGPTLTGTFEGGSDLVLAVVSG